MMTYFYVFHDAEIFLYLFDELLTIQFIKWTLLLLVNCQCSIYSFCFIIFWQIGSLI